MNARNPLHQPETEFIGELQEFEGPALDPNDPSLEPRVRRGRPGDKDKQNDADRKDSPAKD